MLKFGKLPVRSLRSFGVAGLLGEDGKVYYDSLFHTQGVGRLSDLLAAYLRSLGPLGIDELRVRALVLFGAFEVCRVHSRAPGVEDPLAEPLVMECGMDAEKIALGVAFTLPQGMQINHGGLSERIAKLQAKGEFEQILCDLHRHADRLVLRYQPAIQRAEIVALLAIPGKVDPAEVATKPPPEVVLIDGQPDMEVSGSIDYVQLSDLDYNALLKTARPGVAGLEGGDDTRVVSGGSRADEELTRVRGGNTEASGSEKTVVKGDNPADEGDEREVHFKNTTEITGGNDKIVIAGDAPEEAESGRGFAGIFKKVWPFKSAKKDLPEVDPDTELDTDSDTEVVEEDSDGSSPPKIRKKKKKKSLKRSESIDDEVGHSEQEDEGQAEGPIAAEPSEGEAPSAEQSAEKLLEEIEKGKLGSTLERAHRELQQLREEVPNSPAVKRLMDGVMAEMLAEKARIGELAKTLNVTIRHKEFEFRSREGALLEQLRQRDDSIKAKNIALSHSKEQLSQVNASMERLRTTVRQTNNEDQTRKILQAEKALVHSKEENARLAARVEELKNELSIANASREKTKNAGSATELTVMKVKFERIARANEQMRAQNDQLTAKVQALNEKVEAAKIASSRAAAGGSEELKKRLEKSLAAVSTHQKEVIQLQNRTERLNLRVQELEREEARLKKELLRAQTEARMAKMGGGGQGAGSGPGQGPGGKGNPPKAA